MLDIRTLSVATGSVELFFCVPFLSLLIGRKPFPGILQWTAGLAAGFCGLLLLALRGAVPDFMSFVLSNVLLAANGAFVVRGLKAFLGRPQVDWLDAAALVLAAAATQLFISPWPNTAARITVFSFVSVFFVARASLVVATGFPDSIRHQKWILLGTFGAYILFHVSRIVLALLFVQPGADFMTSDAYQALTFFVGIGWVVIASATFLATITRALQQELSEARDEVQRLTGLLPICASCKRIRGEDGSWTSVELYVSARSEVTFSHGVCPDCAEKLYPGIKPRG